MKRHRRTFFLVILLIALAASAAFAAPAAGAATGRVCDACGRLIEGAHFETGGKLYHPECFMCEQCEEPIKGPFTVFRGKNYHTACFEEHVALRCAVCGGIVEGQYLLDYWGNAYHTRHKNEVLQCDFCQRFIVGALGNGMKRLPDGRALCSKCAPASIVNVREARSIMADVAKKLARFGVEVDPGPVGVLLVGQKQLADISENTSHETKGFTDYLVKKGPFGRVQMEEMKVYLLYGMPRTQFVGTVAHELMHIWQFQRGCLEQDPALSEGSCNYASYLVLKLTRGVEADFVIDGMLKDPDPIYGRGFRGVKMYVEREGIRAWLRALEKHSPNLGGL
jgi:hypothetical protein